MRLGCADQSSSNPHGWRRRRGDSHYATMDIGPIDQVKEGWNQRFESIKGEPFH